MNFPQWVSKRGVLLRPMHAGGAFGPQSQCTALVRLPKSRKRRATVVRGEALAILRSYQCENVGLGDGRKLTIDGKVYDQQ